MNKGVIVEQKKRYIVVMDHQGQFHKAKPISNEDIGMEVVFEKKQEEAFLSFFSLQNYRWKVATMAIIFALFITPLYLWTNEEEAYAVVSLDINPSVELMVDKEMRIIEVDPLNEDGKILIQNLELMDQTITNGMDLLVERASDQYDLNNNRAILMGVSYLDNGSEMLEELDAYFSEKSYELAIFEVSSSIRETAMEQKKSMNEILASEIHENKVKNTNSENTSLNDEEREIIQNFYYNDSEEENDSQKNSGEQELDSEETNQPNVKPANEQKDKKKEKKKQENNQEQNQEKNKDKERKKEKTDGKKEAVKEKVEDKKQQISDKKEEKKAWIQSHKDKQKEKKENSKANNGKVKEKSSDRSNISNSKQLKNNSDNRNNKFIHDNGKSNYKYYER
ncbi:anti-sigma-I factor RsgI family protein [Saliterribacillus persicus]|uniref:RsgI N-terminal anti-sigma domain-containing protein n=1 Tax=Saliterribacillus persicus TaxID=930114 RepID=A0A368YCT8_9BACI|nr:hypothetical protein [Saliterribacillus persicus]RCW77146.1 hypothetical protein DFR57_10113 [Saliterribacillus persicus]